MIRIIHLSDFHMNKQSLEDWNNFIKDALTRLANERGKDYEDCFIVCTGDLIDKGGQEYGGAAPAFEDFKKQVIEPILKATGLGKDHFIIVPGNHDIERDADKSFERIGIRQEFAEGGATTINQYANQLLAEEKNKSPFKRMLAFKEFEKNLYQDCDNVATSYLGTTFVFDVRGGKVGFAGLNSVWNAADDKDKECGVEVSEPQYQKCLRELKECQLKIALIHHPLDWLKYEINTIKQWISRDYKLLLCGHVHQDETTYECKPYGSIFVNIAPSFTNDIRGGSNGAFANGLTILDYDIVGKNVTCRYYSYNHNERKYVLNNDLVEGGVASFSLPNRQSQELDDIANACLQYIKDKQYTKFDEQIIPTKAHAIKTLKEAFVNPPIWKQGDEYDIQVNVSELLLSKENVIVFGNQESGKSVLLNRMVIELTDNFSQYDLVPALIDFRNVGNRDIETVIREFLGCSSLQLRKLQDSKKVLLMVDNYNPKEEYKYQVKRLYDFLNKSGLRLIATSHSEMTRSVPERFIKFNQIAFELYHLDPFNTERVREMMVKWSPDDEFLARNNKIEQMVKRFTQYSLPCTAMSVSLYLWSTERSDRAPVNHAFLLDIYIEIILDKMSEEGIYRNTFDYSNKCMMIAKIAYDMKKDNLQELDYSKYIGYIQNYLSEVGYTTYEARRIGDYFIQQKLFAEVNGKIAFAHSCFYYFFLAKRMINDPSFKKEIISKTEFYKNAKVLDYYSGLVRTDKELLEFLHDRLNEYFEPLQPVYKEVNIDDCFTFIRENQQKFVPMIDKMDVAAVVKNKPSEEVIEKRLNTVNNKKIRNISENYYNETRLTGEKLITMTAQVLRNLDGIENVDLKFKVYKSLIRNTMIYGVIVKDYLASYANEHNGKLPPSHYKIVDVERFFRMIPLALQLNMSLLVGTAKLGKVFELKLEEDYKEKVSDVERFETLGILWDHTGLKYIDDIKKMIKKTQKNSVQDYLLLKLIYNFSNKVKTNSPEYEQYISLIVEMKARQHKLPFYERYKLMEKLREIKNK